MTVRAGREFLAIPGPTNMPDEVLRAMHRPALDIYSQGDGRFERQPARGSEQDCSPPRADSYNYIANGHGAWEGDA